MNKNVILMLTLGIILSVICACSPRYYWYDVIPESAKINGIKNDFKLYCYEYGSDSAGYVYPAFSKKFNQTTDALFALIVVQELDSIRAGSTDLPSIASISFRIIGDSSFHVVPKFRDTLLEDRYDVYNGQINRHLFYGPFKTQGFLPDVVDVELQFGGYKNDIANNNDIEKVELKGKRHGKNRFIDFLDGD